MRNVNGCWRVAGPAGTPTLLAVSRAFGDRELKRCTAIPLVSHVPSVYSHALTPRDRLLILASDGLWDVMDDTQAIRLACDVARRAGAPPCPLGNDPTAQGSASAAAAALVHRATQLGSQDNVTVVVAWILWADENQPKGPGTLPPSRSAPSGLI